MTESIVEQAVLSWLTSLDYGIRYSPKLSPGEPEAERADYCDVMLVERLSEALAPELLSGEVRVRTSMKWKEPVSWTAGERCLSRRN